MAPCHGTAGGVTVAAPAGVPIGYTGIEGIGGHVREPGSNDPQQRVRDSTASQLDQVTAGNHGMGAVRVGREGHINGSDGSSQDADGSCRGG